MRKARSAVDLARTLTGDGNSKRIYCVVAETVQVPVGASIIGPVPWDYHVEIDNRNVVQPAGRLAAQAAHAVSLARLELVQEFILQWCVKVSRSAEVLVTVDVWTALSQPITTIVLGARDSRELRHVVDLLRKNRIGVSEFFDTDQSDYGSTAAKVMTAVATAPVEPGLVEGILDYLPLWSPR